MKFIFLALITLIFSCSSYQGVNRIGSSELSVRGGIKGNQEWSDSLIFKRTSFYREANLYYDIMISKLDSESPFILWFGNDLPENCNTKLLLLSYVKFGSEVNNAYLRKQIEKNNYKEVTVPELSAHLKANVVYRDNNLEFYKIKAYCSEKSQNEDHSISIDLPGYRTIVLDI